MAIQDLIATQYARTNQPLTSRVGRLQQIGMGQKGLERADLQNQALQAQQGYLAEDREASKLAATTQASQDKARQGMQFAANVGAQLQQVDDPAEKAGIYQMARQMAARNGHDVRGFPEQYSPEAEQMLEVAYQQVYQPEILKQRIYDAQPYSDVGRLMADRDRISQAGGDTAVFDDLIKARRTQATRPQPLTENQRNFSQFQRLQREDPEAAQQFGRQAGFVSREGQKLSAHMEKRNSQATDAAMTARGMQRQLGGLADKFRGMDNVGSGLFAGRWKNAIKEMTGSQDYETELRQAQKRIINSDVIQNLPPGPATDFDFRMVRDGYPTDFADGNYVADYLESLSRLQGAAAEFNTFKANFISEHGAERDRNGKSMLSHWKDKVNQEKSARPQRRDASSQALEYLKSNPGTIDQFEQIYGYRPEGY